MSYRNALQVVNIARVPDCLNRRAIAPRAGSVVEERTQTNLRPSSMEPMDSASTPANAPYILSMTPVAYVHQVGDDSLVLLYVSSC